MAIRILLGRIWSLEKSLVRAGIDNTIRKFGSMAESFNGLFECIIVSHLELVTKLMAELRIQPMEIFKYFTYM